MAKYSGKEREQAIEPITAERGETETSFQKQASWPQQLYPQVRLATLRNDDSSFRFDQDSLPTLLCDLDGQQSLCDVLRGNQLFETGLIKRV